MAFTRTRFITIATLFTALAVSSSAFAHAHLKHQYPAADAAVTAAPQAITLNFSEGVEANFSGLTLTGPQQTVVKTGTAKRNEKDDKQLIVPVEEAMKPGDYQVDWHVVSVDGHKTKGKYHFSVK
ncbi:CopC domain-containing protein YobA [Buttiauxella noackiae]|uniref:Copper resistance protein C n=1 Tax=Buttiauxella noackiae ATCC 51607 TaxID=1354255 RepID=A0A1B7HT62_9ENTR|nr:CopC domain-containing protein YobA [Buttiauxella noackiae]OAT18867.1 copper resistance protein C [Buttiauxella noackiae ATCC 51607]